MHYYLKIEVSPETEKEVKELLSENYPGLKLPPEGEIFTVNIDSVLQSINMTAANIIQIVKMVKK